MNIDEDMVKNPSHYKLDCGLECKDVAGLFTYNVGNAIKYAWRAGKKDDLIQDLKKCMEYIDYGKSKNDFDKCQKLLVLATDEEIQALEKLGDLYLNKKLVDTYPRQWEIVNWLQNLEPDLALNILVDVVKDLEKNV